MREGAVMFGVANGEAFVPRLFAELGRADQGGRGRASVARRRVPHVHRHDDPDATAQASALEQAVATRPRRRG